MRTIIAKLFSRSPFVPLQTHMSKVRACVDCLAGLFAALESGDHAELEKISDRISEHEHEADLTKTQIRNTLTIGVLLPVDKNTLLQILALQDSMADRCQDVGILLTLKKLKLPEQLRRDFQQFLDKNVECYAAAERIIQELDELLETSFSGPAARKVVAMIDDVSFKEHEGDLLQRQLLKHLFALEGELSYGTFIIWLEVVSAIGALSNLSENLGNRVHTILDMR